VTGSADVLAGDELGGTPAVLVLEYVVAELDQALELLVDTIGMQVVDRYAHPAFDADVVTLRAGTVAITLLHPTDVGDRPPFGSPEPRLAQVTLGIPGDNGVPDLVERLNQKGAATVLAGSGAYLATQMIEAVFGTAPTFLFTPLPT
jgi:catechol 2,3-dioxygenase-like lactoylglutathione lyase family enzyme